MEIIDRKSIPIYEAICPECKSVLQYKKSELHLGGYLTCPVCGDTVWGSAIKPVKYMDNSEEMANNNVPTIHIERHGHWNWFDGVRCSCCNYKLQTTGIPSYCPKCGAKMDRVK